MLQEEQELLILLPMVRLTLLAMVSWTLCIEIMDSMELQEDLLILPIKSCRWNYTKSIRYTQIMKWLRKGKSWDSMNANTMVSFVYQLLIPTLVTCNDYHIRVNSKLELLTLLEYKITLRRQHLAATKIQRFYRRRLRIVRFRKATVIINFY